MTSTAFTPRAGMHALRIPVLDVALVDVAGTLVIAGLLARWLRVRFWKVCLALFVAGVVAHRLAGVRTRVDVALFG